jgi:hypothetical protein
VTKRTVVLVEPRGDDTIEIRLSKAPREIEGARVPKTFDCDPDQMPQWSQAGAIQAHGRTIFDKLGQHDAIKEAFKDLLGDVGSLYFHLVADEAERLSWETLCDTKGRFLALNPRWPIGRMADSEVDLGIPPGDFGPPLRIMAILSALHRTAKPEWDGLFKAVREAIDDGLQAELTVVVSEENLLKEIRQEIASQEKAAPPMAPWLKVEIVPDRVITLGKLLERHRPQIIHFYSHGSVSSGISQLHLATIADWDEDAKGAGSLMVTLDALLGFPEVHEAWLVTLNCCEGGKAANDLHSMAHQLVAKGVPAAIGMLEPVNAPDAHEFVEFFYPELLKNLGKAIGQAKASGKGVEFEWAPALHPPRSALSERHKPPEDHRAWTFPVLYVRTEPFAIRYAGPAAPPAPDIAVQPAPPPVVPMDPTMKVRIETVAGTLRTLPPGTPKEVRTGILALLNDVPPELRPNLDGTISGDVQ